MKFVKPGFYDQFRCTASACKDSCCLGWEIDIDPDTEEYYAAVEGPFGERLRENMERLPEGGACFRLTEEERCPFLNDENLCEVILTLGEDALCEICREHPRFYEQIDDRLEMGVGLCCEEACRLLFALPGPLAFITTTMGETGQSGVSKIFRMRHEAFRIVQESGLPLRVRIHRLLDFAARKERALFGKSKRAQNAADEVPAAREMLLQVMEALEPYDETWPEYVRLLDDETLEVNFDELDGRYENLLIYFLYRHFARGAFDGRLFARVAFCAVSVWFICLMNTHRLSETGAFTPEDRILCTKDYAKQVEYSENNMEDMLDALHTEPSFTLERLKALFG